MKRNIKLLIEYDGTDFVGWQRQLNGRTVQEEIEKALKTITQEEIGIVGAGRTDSGVHARGQVANFNTSSILTLNDFYRGLNGIVPDDIVIRKAEEADEKFSARYSATAREYRYVISKNPTAIDRKYCWQIGYQFDIEKMNRIALSILEMQDFQSFCKSDSDLIELAMQSAKYYENHNIILTNVDCETTKYLQDYYPFYIVKILPLSWT
ncbi:MAG: tRNA pseudouridine synthase A, partial [Bacteroidota bacterium]